MNKILLWWRMRPWKKATRAAERLGVALNEINIETKKHATELPQPPAYKF